MRLLKKGIITLVILSAIYTGCAAGVVSSSWCGDPLQIDGKSVDWNLSPQVYNENLSGTVAVQNDADYLYLLLRFKDPKQLGSFARSGLTIWTNYEGRKKRSLGFTYKSRALIEHFKVETDSSVGPGGPPGFQALRAAEPSQEEIIIHDNEQFRREMMPADGSKGIRAAFGEDNGIYLYEISIPLALCPRHSFAIGTRPGQKICIGIEGGGDAMRRRLEEISEMPGGMAPGIRGGPPGDMGRAPGGREPRGGKTPEAGFGRPFEGEKLELWLKLKLAEKP